MMNQEAVEALVQKYLEDRCDAEEKAIVESWYNLCGEKNEVLASSTDMDLTQELIWKNVLRLAPPPKKKHLTLNRIAAAASLILVMGLAFWFYTAQQGQDNSNLALTRTGSHDIGPGHNRATLTLGNGSVINLSGTKRGVVIDENKLRYNDGTEIPAPSAGQSKVSGEQEWLTASTPRGGQYQIVLPDGSKVWLNAASRLSFPATFSGSANRKVELSGEAYFEIYKDSTHPFIVQSKGQEVEVLGTHFNIKGYEEEGDTKTTVLEGSVKVALQHAAPHTEGAQVILKPNQQAVLSGYKYLVVKEVDALNAASWKNGKFIFNSEALGSIMKQAERWYNVEVVFQDDVKNLLLTGSISRNENISGLLKILAATKEVSFTVERNQVLVKKAK